MAKHLEKWQGRSVLVVDDSASSRCALSSMLSSLGFAAIYEAEEGQQALDLLKMLPRVDLLLTDLNMPGIDGIKLLEILAESPPAYPLYVAVMSGVHRDVLDSVQGIADAVFLELLAVLPKPVALGALQEMLAGCDPNQHIAASKKQDVSASLRDVSLALAQDQLQPFFQPKVKISTGELVGMEALVRWLHPTHGVVAPMMFVQHLESGPLALDFLYQFVDKVGKFLAGLSQHRGPGAPLLHCSVNVPVPLLEVDALVQTLESILMKHGLPNHCLVIELTETSLMSNLGPAIGTLARMRMKGFGIAMDDYGTGYSSMKQLSRCPFTELKIDREFVHDASSSTKKLAILQAAIAMCQKLNLLCVAEGVETAADWEQLAALGCDVAQGYFVSRPLPAAQFLEWQTSRFAPGGIAAGIVSA